MDKCTRDEMMDPVSFENAVADPAGKILAWDLNERKGERTLSVFSRATGGARQIAWKKYTVADQEVISRGFAARGFVIGSYDYIGPAYLWVVSNDAVTVWDTTTQLLDARDRKISFSLGQTLEVEEVSSFIAYADGYYVDRGVNALLKTGKKITVLYHLSMAASSDPTYSRNDLLMDTEWCNAIARALADWAHVAYVDEI